METLVIDAEDCDSLHFDDCFGYCDISSSHYELAVAADQPIVVMFRGVELFAGRVTAWGIGSDLTISAKCHEFYEEDKASDQSQEE